MMAEQAKAVGKTARGQRTDLGFRETHVPTLKEAGIDKGLATRCCGAGAGARMLDMMREKPTPP